MYETNHGLPEEWLETSIGQRKPLPEVITDVQICINRNRKARGEERSKTSRVESN